MAVHFLIKNFQAKDGVIENNHHLENKVFETQKSLLTFSDDALPISSLLGTWTSNDATRIRAHPVMRIRLNRFVRGRYRKLAIIARPQRQPPINVAPVKDRFSYLDSKPRTFLDALKLIRVFS